MSCPPCQPGSSVRTGRKLDLTRRPGELGDRQPWLVQISMNGSAWSADLGSWQALLVGQAAAAAGTVAHMGHPAVRAMLTDDQAPTCSLVEFLEAWNEEPNLVWRVRTGHLIHLLEAAVARIEALETLLSEMEGSDVDTEVGETTQVRRPSHHLAGGWTRGGS